MPAPSRTSIPALARASSAVLPRASISALAGAIGRTETDSDDTGDVDSPRRTADEVVVESVSVDGGTVTARVDSGGTADRFLSGEDFFVEYDRDVSDVPAGILTIPVLSHVCPVAWAAGADVRVPVADERFLDSLERVGNTLCEMYPSFMDGGRVVAGDAVDASEAYDRATGTGMLFTGGVDSLATYARHRDEDPILVNVQGWVVDIDDDEQWAHTQAVIDDYGRRLNAETRFVRSNMLEFLETPLLAAHFNDRHDGSWYSAVASGLGMLGLCAPLSVVDGMDRIYVGASMWEGMPVPDLLDLWDGRAMPWGSHPDVDDAVAWGATDARHDAFELSRQDRIGVVANFVRAEGPDDLVVRSCGRYEAGENCNRCEKCVRTAFGLALAGLDPNDHGFDVDASTFDYAREQFEAGEWLKTAHSPYYYREFKEILSADPRPELPIETNGFVDWLLEADFDAFVGSPERDRIVRAAARRTPSRVYHTLYPAYQALQHRVGGE